MTLRARLALGFLTIALLLAVPLAVSLRALRETRRATESLRDQAFAASLVLGRVRAATGELQRAEYSVSGRPGDDTSATYFVGRVHALSALADTLHRFALDSLESQMRRSLATIDRFGQIEIAALSDGQTELADRVSDRQVRPAIRAIDSAAATTEAHLRELAKRNVDIVAASTNTSASLAAALLAVAIAGAGVVAFLITRSISRPVQDLERGMQAVAGGNFTHQLSVAPGRSDEFGRLASSYESMATQLAELDKLKAEFVSVASHELKTPINVIMGYLKLLEEKLYGPLGDRQAEVVGIMQTQAESLARLVQHLLDVSRFQAGTARLEARPMTLRGFLTQLEATYEVLAMQRGITFSVVASESLPDVVTWDIDRINEVIGNLLSNAFKFTESGGRVDLVVSSLEEAVYIEVRDTGVGIAPQQLPHIFDKFFQADNQAGTGAKGTGLGLAISKEIVEAHGGSIAAESTIGVGTKFSIMLPVSATAPAPNDSGAASPDLGHAAAAHAGASA